LAPHPGTQAGRARAWNPQIPPAEFEHRFIATRARLSERRWDFIVVGAGSAGCVLASRLSQDPKVQVLLIEGGGEAQNARIIKDPRNATRLVGCEADWGFRSTPQPQLLPSGRILDLERGKGLGGSSCLNYNMWVRGAPEDFDRWNKEYGCGEEWSYAGVLPHFEAIERCTAGSSEGAVAAPAGRGSSGELSPQTPWPPPPEIGAFLESAELHGIPQTGDYNGPGGQAGSGLVEQSVDKARTRADAFNTFVEPYLRTRPNLAVASEGFVRRLVFDGTHCVGVEVQLNDGSLTEVRASSEVILSAGALQSPQLLMLSGVGDAKALASLGIPLVADVPAVGQHLQDHPVIPVPFTLPDNLADEFGVESIPTGTSGLNGIAFWKTEVDKQRDQGRGSESGCDMETILVSRFDPGLLVKVVVSKAEAWLSNIRSGSRPWTERAVVRLGRWLSQTEAVKKDIARTMYVATEYNHPISRGTVALRSADPLAPPLVDCAWVRDPSDLDAMVESVKKMREMLRTGPLAKFVGDMQALPGIHSTFASGPAPFFEASDAQLRDFVRHAVGTTWHYSCTARMGAPDAPLSEAALDPRLRVRGVTGLRVADQSVTPFVVSANTNASSMMIGDKAAKLILQDHRLGPFREVRSAL